MYFYGDYHTHTLFSDSSNTVRGLLTAAREKGLKEIAITDHGYCNKWLSLTPFKFDWQTRRIEEIKKDFPELTVLHGIEADIIDTKGTVDMQPNELDKVDILLAGFHRFTDSTSYKDYFRFVIYNGFLEKIKKPTAAQIEMNTNAYIEAIKNYPIDVITHLNHRASVDVEKVCRVAAEYGTMIEINIKHFVLVEPYIELMLKSGCTFIVNSDAHKLKRIGNFAKAEEVIGKYGIPEERVANLNKKPTFTRLNEYKKARIENGQAKL